MIKKADFLAIAKDRSAVLLLIGMIVEAVVLIATIVFRLHASDIQIPVRYTGYGQTFIYRDQWYMQYSFALFAIIVTLVNTFLAIKLYHVRRMLSLGMLGMSIFLLLVGVVVSNAVLNLAPSL